jgi:integrase
LLATSGLRVGEAAALKVGNLELLSNKITLASSRTKSRRSGITFLSDEAAGFLREYLGPRVNRKDEWVFPAKDPNQHDSAGALYNATYRVLKKLNLIGKLDPESRRNQLHPDSFRKFFFSKLIGAGVELWKSQIVNSY